MNEKLLLIPLGGLGEIGKNMMVLQFDDSIVVVDAGLAFPDDDMPGVDLVIPDISYLIENKDKVLGIILTHGHEDHVGALPYILKSLDVPVYGTPLTLAVVESKFSDGADFNGRVVKDKERITLGPFEIEFLRVCHSIADGVGLAIKTPIGLIVHTGDFKFDQTPVDGRITDYRRFAELGDEGVLLLLSDSTNAEHEGYTPSEREIGVALNEIFMRERDKRIIIATFSSNIHRIQQVMDAALRYGRKVSIVGKSMMKLVELAKKLGYLSFSDDMLIPPEDVEMCLPNEVVIITTGSQGEPLSGLSLMASGGHKYVKISSDDVVVISALPIPGNERLVTKTVNLLFQRGAEVLYEPYRQVHVSGHASREELKLMLNFTRPRYFVPIHGEFRHLVRHARLAEEMGIPKESIFILSNGDVLEISRGGARVKGRIQTGAILIDGFGVGDVVNEVLRERKRLSKDGIVVVSLVLGKDGLLCEPKIESQGFIYEREWNGLMEDAKDRILKVVKDSQGLSDSLLEAKIVEGLRRLFLDRTGRFPVIIPILMRV